MATLKGSKTEANLKAAFAGESQANRRYLYFAQKADVEGYNDVAAVFRSTAEGETGHAHGHLEFLEGVGDPATGSDTVSLPAPTTLVGTGSTTVLGSNVNVTGDLVVTDDLLAALAAGRLAAAALDVTSPEPLPADHPLRQSDRVVVSSHVASATPQAVRNLRTSAAQAVARALKGEPAVNVVNGVTP